MSCNVGVFWLLLHNICLEGGRNWTLHQERHTQNKRSSCLHGSQTWWMTDTYDMGEEWTENQKNVAFRYVGMALTNRYRYLNSLSVSRFQRDGVRERSVAEHPECGVKPVVRSQRRPIVNQDYSITIPSLAYWKDNVTSHCFSPMKIVN